jgi:GNAT superfamily N-acetyltransferase
MMVTVDLQLNLATRASAKRVSRGRRDPGEDLPWADGYPMEGDQRACVAYLRQLPVLGGGGRSHPFGYYQIVLDGVVAGGIGFHAPPRDGVVEVGYGVVPSVRRQGVATEALRRILAIASDLGTVRRVCGRTTPDNIASQRVMINCGLRMVGRDPEFLHFETDLPGTDPPAGA